MTGYSQEPVEVVDPFPMRSGVCDNCGEEFCNFSGRCLACDPWGWFA